MKRCGWFLVTAALLVGADKRQDALQQEYAKFQGTWRFVSIEAEGAKSEEADFKDARLIIKGNTFQMPAGPERVAGTFKLDPTQKPKTIDVTFADGPEKGKTALGIYELTGDTYKVCIGLVGKERPKEFVSKPGSGHVLETLQRDKR